MKYEKCNVVMLPTEKASSIWKDKEEGEIQYGDCHPDNPDWVAQHLYVTNPNEDIKEGDWFYNTQGNYISKSTDRTYGVIGKTMTLTTCQKIIATTDKSLEYNRKQLYDNGLLDKDFQGFYKHLPRPSNEFLKKYCELGGIDKVLVEYNSKCNDTMFCELPCSMDFISCNHLKVAPDNTITIIPIKDSWNRKEVVELFEKYIDAGKPILYPWIKENL